MRESTIGETDSISKLQAFTTAVDLAQKFDGDDLLAWERLFAAAGEWALLEAPTELPRHYLQMVYTGIDQLLVALATIAAIEEEMADESGAGFAQDAPGRWRSRLPRIIVRWLFGWQANPAAFPSYVDWSFDEFVSSFRILGRTAQLTWLLLRPWPLAAEETITADEEPEVGDEQEEIEDEEQVDGELVAGAEEDEPVATVEEEAGVEEFEDSADEADVFAAATDDEPDLSPLMETDDCAGLLDELAQWVGIDPQAPCTPEQLAGLEAQLEFSPVDVDARWELAYCLAQAQSFAQAIAHYQEALHLRPENDEVIKQLCYCFAASAQWDEAFAEAHKLLADGQSETEAQDLLDMLTELQAACAD